MFPTLGTKRFLVVAVILAAFGLFAVVVGSHDVFAARTVGSRLFGAFLAVGGLMMWIAALGVFRRATWHVALSLVGSFAALLVGLALLLAQWKEGGGQESMLLVWAGVVAAALIALGLSLRPGAPEVTKAVRRVQLVAVAGMAIGIAQFAFTNVFGPAPGGPFLNVSTRLEKLGERNGVIAVKVRLGVENTSKRRVLVVDSIYLVRGLAVVAEGDLVLDPFIDQLEVAATDPAPGMNDVAAERGPRGADETVLRTGQVLERGYSFQPGESLAREFVVHVRKDRYHLIRLSASIDMTDFALLDLGDEPVFRPKREDREYKTYKYTVVDTGWNVRETSWVRRLVQRDSVLWTRWLLRSVPSRGLLPFQVSYIDEKGGDFDPWTGKPFPSHVIDLTNKFGLQTSYSGTELSLFPALPPP